MFKTLKGLVANKENLTFRLNKPENINPDGIPRNMVEMGAKLECQTIVSITEFPEGTIYKIHRREQVRENLAVVDGFSYVIVPRESTKLFEILELCDFKKGLALMGDQNEINAFFDSRWNRLVELYESFKIEQRELFRPEIVQLLKSWPGELKGVYIKALEPNHEQGSFDEMISFFRSCYGGNAIYRGDPKIFHRMIPQGFRFPVDGQDFFLQKIFYSGERLFVHYKKDGDALYAVVKY